MVACGEGLLVFVVCEILCHLEILSYNVWLVENMIGLEKERAMIKQCMPRLAYSCRTVDPV